MTETVPVRVRHGPDSDEETVLSIPVGTVLRDALLEAGISPHGRYARRVNCRGNVRPAAFGSSRATATPIWHTGTTDWPRGSDTRGSPARSSSKRR